MSKIARMMMTGLLGGGGILTQTLTLQPNALAGKDTYIRSNIPTGNYGTIDPIQAGEHNAAGIIGRILAGFNLAAIPDNAEIVSATLSLYAVTDVSSTPRTYRVYRLKRAWTETGATWNSYDGTNNWQTAGGFGADDCEQVEIGSRDFSATETLNEFKDFPLTPTSKAGLDLGYGWLIKADTETNDGYFFASSDNADPTLRPKLTVTYRYRASDALDTGGTNTVTFLENYEGSGTVGYWEKIDDYTELPYSFQVSTDTARRGTHSARFEVRPGDGGAVTERSEEAELRGADTNMIREDGASGTVYYGISIYLPADYQELSSNVLLQLHGPTPYGANPSFALRDMNGVYAVTLEGGNLEAVPNPYLDYTAPLAKYAPNYGHWTDFVFKVLWKQDATGSVDVWRRDEGESRFTRQLMLRNVPTLQYKPSLDGGTAGTHFWKSGYYRPLAAFTGVLYHDCIVRAGSFAAAVNAAWGG